MTQALRTGPEAAGAGATSPLALVASCFAGQRVSVLLHDGPSCFDGEVLRVARLPHREQVFSVIAQAALLRGGTFDARPLQRVSGRPGPARRYFDLEVARTTAAVRDSLPRPLAEMLAPHWETGLPADAAESAARALGVEAVQRVPELFGELHARAALRGARARAAATPTASAQAERGRVDDGDDDAAEDDGAKAERSALLRLLSSPAAGSAASTLLGKLVPMRRRADAASSGSGGVEVAVGRRRAPSGATSRAKAGRGGSVRGHSQEVVDGVYPEWDQRAQRYRPDWCTVGEYDVPANGERTDLFHADPRLPRRLVRIGLDREPHRRQVEGEDLDVDALVEYAIDVAVSGSGDERIHRRRRQTGRDLSVFVLLDASGSSSSGGAAGRTVFEQHATVAYQLVAAFDALGARTALFGFSSYGRRSVRLLRVKDVNDPWDETALRRLAAVEAGGFTRLGAAVRHATRLAGAGGTTNQLLIVLSDCVPYDEGYESDYARADSRRALEEVRLSGVAVACVSASSSTSDRDVEQVYGAVPHLVLRSYEDLPAHVAQPLLTAVRGVRAQQRQEQYVPTHTTH